MLLQHFVAGTIRFSDGLGRLQGPDAVDVHQCDELNAIGRRIGQRKVGAGQGHKLRVPDLVKLAVGKPQLKGFEGLAAAIPESRPRSSCMSPFPAL